jgi:hypothetical protein
MPIEIHNVFSSRYETYSATWKTRKSECGD